MFWSCYMTIHLHWHIMTHNDASTWHNIYIYVNYECKSDSNLIPWTNPIFSSSSKLFPKQNRIDYWARFNENFDQVLQPAIKVDVDALVICAMVGQISCTSKYKRSLQAVISQWNWDWSMGIAIIWVNPRKATATELKQIERKVGKQSRKALVKLSKLS